MLERHFQVLSIVADCANGNITGIKAGDIYDECKRQRQCLVKDQSQVSSVLNQLKSSGLVNALKHEREPDHYIVSKTGTQSLIANGWEPGQTFKMRIQEKPIELEPAPVKPKPELIKDENLTKAPQVDLTPKDGEIVTTLEQLKPATAVPVQLARPLEPKAPEPIPIVQPILPDPLQPLAPEAKQEQENLTKAPQVKVTVRQGEIASHVLTFTESQEPIPKTEPGFVLENQPPESGSLAEIIANLGHAQKMLASLENLKIANKDTKIQLLQKMAAMFNEEISGELADLIDFLQRFGTA